MPSGGSRPNAGRKRKVSKQEFEQWFANMCLEYINHRHGDAPINKLPLYYIPQFKSEIQISTSELRKRFGTLAIESIKLLFDLVSGHAGHNSTLTLQTNAHGELLLFLNEQGLVNKLRTDKDGGLFDSWIVTTKKLLAQRAQFLLKLAKNGEKYQQEYDEYADKYRAVIPEELKTMEEEEKRKREKKA